MSSYENEFKEEELYINNTISLLNKNLEIELNKVSLAQKELMNVNKYMWENSVHYIDDIDRLADIKQDLSVIHVQRAGYEEIEKKIYKYKSMRKKPYFARIDFKEEDESNAEKIYIGFNNLLDEYNYELYVYDWRSPIASIFYRYELGAVSYKAPKGEIKGETSLKRQYEIKNGKLDYFIDSNLNIIDDALKNALSKNTSSKMKTIVETIQREQDIIIRDIENDLLIVQGVAGSGKTSIALHRVAFLMYQGLVTKLYSNNIIIISPNDLFGNYISDVLPELGEETIKTITFEYIFKEIFNNSINIKSRNQLLEDIIDTKNTKKRNIIKSSMEFKASKEFVIILQRLIWYFEHRMIEILDIYYDGIYIEDKHSIKESLLKGTINMPIEKKLTIIENRIFEKIQSIRKKRREKLEKFISRYPHHQFEIKALARLITIKETYRLKEQINSFTKVDYMKVYKNLFKDKNLFYHLAKGLNLPGNIEEIIDSFNCDYKVISYEDTLSIMYLKVKMSGCNVFKEIKQVVVDEAQDYYPIHFEILKELFKNSKFTILGDINQSIEKEATLSIYEDAKNILNKKRSMTVYMNKSFRCSYEISKFSNKFLDENIKIESFERHEEEPEVIKAVTTHDLDENIVKHILNYKNLNYTSIAVLCKSMNECEKIYKRLKKKIDMKIINGSNVSINGVMIMPVYMAKGLEFDCVIVYETNNRNYNTEVDKRLLYIASTRALHKLVFFYTGSKSKYLEVNDI
ncbi:HelD family protein [Clostridium uliginosum]|uniref:DNA helicase-2 / ATP-dependent DNA helicase PcrA n=1 Tax=Clostridium uliginosum TaxID=119641 RepID=A0A1I1NEX0_9CLOT|nr:UvrD-helicase domain-containing protein [Clostridium uliginosum]SFC93323.1 DNA helicase-2 / ATP-dependent DNA helicase PcrA [Clostridium uliginosum]